MRKKKIALTVSSPLPIMVFWRKHIEFLLPDYDVTVIANIEHDAIASALAGIPGIRLKHIPIRRKISLFADLKALVMLAAYFRREKFLIVHSTSPKAGLLAMSAAAAVRIRHRFHTFTGQVWATKTGWKRMFLKNIDRLLFHLTTFALVDSASQLAFLRQNGVVTPEKSAVCGNGSISGVDCDRFQPDAANRRQVRDSLGFGDSEVVLLYIGRLNREKGIPELVRAFAASAPALPSLRLLIIGSDEDGIAGPAVAAAGDCASRIKILPFTSTPEKYMASGDIFCLPSHREGFGSVIIEAAACGLPAIGSDIYGIQDAIVDGETGLLHPSGDEAALAAKIRQLATHDELRQEMGRRALARAREVFSAEFSSASLRRFYQEQTANAV